MPIEATWEMEFTKILARKYELKEDTGGAGTSLECPLVSSVS